VNELAVTIPVTRVSTRENPTTISSIIPSPTIADSAVFGTSPKGIDDINCGHFEDTEETYYWADDFIPGESTIDDLLQVIELSDGEDPTQVGPWSYFHTDNENEVYFALRFLDGNLIDKRDPRQRLGDVISYYGYPEHITWIIHVNRNVLEYDKAVLFFPQSNAVFTSEGEITDFSSEAIFTSFIYTTSEFEEQFAEISSKISSDQEIVQHFPWPCG
jgi:hypothetical protein